MDLADRTPEDEIAALRHELAAARAQLGTAAVEIAHLRAQLAALRRQQYGQSSERLDAEIAQLELRLEDLEENEAEHRAARPDLASRDAPLRPRAKAVRRPLPDHLPRETVMHEPTTLCTCCEPGKLARLGEDVTEILEKVPARLKVTHNWFGLVAVKLRSTRSGAGLASLSRRVVVGPPRRWLAPTSPASRIRRAIRLRPCAAP